LISIRLTSRSKFNLPDIQQVKQMSSLECFIFIHLHFKHHLKMNLLEYKKRNNLRLHQLCFMLKVSAYRLQNLLYHGATLTDREELELALADTSLPLDVKAQKVGDTYLITLNNVPFMLHPWQSKHMDAGTITADDDNTFVVCKYKGREVVKIIQRGVVV